MKRTFQLVSAALLLTVASVAAQAQGGGGGGGGRGAGQRTAMFKDITLTAAQTASVDSIFKIATDKNTELRKDMQQGTPPTDELRAKMTAVSTDRNEAIKKVLTAEQLPVYEKNLKELPQRGGRGGL